MAPNVNLELARMNVDPVDEREHDGADLFDGGFSEVRRQPFGALQQRILQDRVRDLILDAGKDRA